MVSNETPHWTSIALGALTLVVSGVAIWSSVIAVNASNDTNETIAAFEVGAETDRARAEYLREQRQIAYADFLTKDSSYYDLLNELTEDLALTHDAAWKVQENTVGNDLYLSLNTVRIVGSDEGIQAAEALLMYYKVNPIGEMPNGFKTGTSPDVRSKPVVLNWTLDIRSNFSTLREKFIAIAQHDVRGG